MDTPSPGITSRPLTATALVLLAAVLLSVWPPRTAQARMNKPDRVAAYSDDAFTGGAVPTTGSFTLSESVQLEAAVRFTVYVTPGESDSVFGCWERPAGGSWTFIPLLQNATLTGAQGRHTGVFGIRAGHEYVFDFGTTTRGTVIASILYDGVS